MSPKLNASYCINIISKRIELKLFIIKYHFKEALNQQKHRISEKIPFQVAIDNPAKLHWTSSHRMIGAWRILFINSVDDKLFIDPDVQVDGPSHQLNSTPT